jgi:hypothetical protein
MRVVDLIWMIGPEFQDGAFSIAMDVVMLIGLGGLWLAFFVHQLKMRPLLPIGDPEFEQVLLHSAGH